MDDSPWLPKSKTWGAPSPAAIGALARAATAVGKLDQALDNHPLLPAVLYRARLDAVRQMAASDGLLIDPWHFAALLEGMKFRMDSELRIIDRGTLLDAARRATELHGWLVQPDFDQEGDIRRAEKLLIETRDQGHPLLTAGRGLHGWIEAGGAREPMRAALVRYWRRQNMFRHPLPVTGAGALRADVPWDPECWLPAFLEAVALEAETMLQMVYDFERAWRAARMAVEGRRRHSHAALAVDILAAGPVLSATSLARGLGISVKSALVLLESFLTDELVIEVSHRSKRRLFALPLLAPLREAARPPTRPDPLRGRGRRKEIPVMFENEAPSPALLSSPGPLPLFKVDYAVLEAAIANAEDVIRRTKMSLGKLATGVKP